MRLFAGGAAIGLLPDFPIEILLIVLLLASSHTAWLGLESVARSATFFLVPTILSFFTLVVAALKSFDIRHLFPIFGPGPEAVVIQGFMMTGLWGALPGFLVFKTYVRSERDLAKGTGKGLLIAGAVVIASVVTVLMFFPYPSSTRLAHPLGILARSIFIGRFLQRLEALFVFAWFFPSALQASFAFLTIALLLSQIAGTQTYRPFLPSLVTLSFGIAAIPTSTFRSAELLSITFFDTFGVAILPLGWILYAIARMRGVKPKPNHRSQGGENSNANEGNDVV